jgi:secondary thiamine-phosphate synthase enzyme
LVEQKEKVNIKSETTIPCTFTANEFSILLPVTNKNQHLMISQIEFTLRAKNRGFHLITDEVVAQLPKLPETGILHLFMKHTSAGLSINENADPDVQTDMGQIFDRLIKEHEPYYVHTLEGDDDMPAHAKSSIIGVSLNIPITKGRLNLGTWQGIYLCEFRLRGSGRKIVATIIS